jgi:predicted transcriptional regulator
MLTQLLDIPNALRTDSAGQDGKLALNCAASLSDALWPASAKYVRREFGKHERLEPGPESNRALKQGPGAQHDKTPIDDRFSSEDTGRSLRQGPPMPFPSAPPSLGDLEIAVLEDIWQHQAADAKAVHARVGVRRAITINTVQSTLERLYRKGLLSREKISHAYAYRATLSRQALLERLVGTTVRRFAADAPEAMLAAFVDLASREGEEQLDRLEALIAERRAAGTAEAE